MSRDSIEFVDYIFDRYDFLGLDPSASKEIIEARVKELRTQNHPDRLRHLAPDLKAQAEGNWQNIDVCAEVLLNDELRPLYDQRLEQFKADKPQLITKNSRTQIINLERDFIDVTFLASGEEADLSYLQGMAATITGYDLKEFERAHKLYNRDPEDTDLLAMYRDALNKKIACLTIFETYLWGAAGVSGRSYTESKEVLMDVRLIGEGVEAQIEHVKDNIIPQFIQRREGLFALGYDKQPVLLLTHNAEIPLASPSPEIASMIEKAQSRFVILSEAVKKNAAERAEAIAQVIELSPFQILHAVSPDAVTVHLAVDTGSGVLEEGAIILSFRYVGSDIASPKEFVGKSVKDVRDNPQAETSVAIMYDQTLNEPALLMGHAYIKTLRHFGQEVEIDVNRVSDKDVPSDSLESPNRPDDSSVEPEKLKL